MLSTLRITAKLHVTPLFDIRYQDVATTYREGLLEQLQHNPTLVPVSHLVACLQRAMTVSIFDGQHQAAARDFVGYHFGSLLGELAGLSSPPPKRNKPIGKHRNKRRLRGWRTRKPDAILNRYPLCPSLRIPFDYSVTCLSLTR